MLGLHPILSSRPLGLGGRGTFAGLPPDPSDPDSPDGRYRKANVPARGRIAVFERSTMRAAASTLSAPDGTWMIGLLNPALDYVVIGFDDSAEQNAAIQDWVKPALPE